MEQRPPRRSRGGGRPASLPLAESRPPAKSQALAKPRPPGKSQAPAKSRAPAEPQGSQLWLFPGDPGLRSALSRRAELTRQVCCARGRLAVLERGGDRVQVHQLPAGSDGAKKPSEWGRAAPLGPGSRAEGVRVGSPGPAPALKLFAGAARVGGCAFLL